MSEFELAKRTAFEAGGLLSGATDARVDSAEGRDIKLSTDKQSEKLIVESLSGTGFSILSEEMGFIDRETDEMWIIDPLDGTANFWRGMRDLCCVSISLWKNMSPVFGIVYRFDRGEMFTGFVGEGAWLNDKPVRTSNVASLSDAYLMTGLPVHSDFSNVGISKTVAPFSEFKKVRMLGSAAIMGSMVACGRADVYTESGIMLWDIAGSVAITLAAGGVTDLKVHDDYTCDCRLFANESLKRCFDGLFV